MLATTASNRVQAFAAAYQRSVVTTSLSTWTTTDSYSRHCEARL